MKKLMFIAAVAASLACSAMYSSVTIDKEKFPCDKMSLFGMMSKAKHITLIDSKNNGTIKMSIGRSADVKNIENNVTTNLTTKYNAFGTTVTAPWYKAVCEIFDLNLVRMGTLDNRPIYGDKEYWYYVDDYPGGMNYEIGTRTNSQGTVYNNCYIFTKIDYVQKLHYNDDFTSSVEGEIWYFLEKWCVYEGGQFVAKETDQFSHAIGTNGFESVRADSIMPVASQESAKMPLNFIEPLPITNTTVSVQTITREYQVCNTNYTNGILEFDLPDNVFLLSDYYIKTDCASLTNGTANLKLIYEK